MQSHLKLEPVWYPEYDDGIFYRIASRDGHDSPWWWLPCTSRNSLEHDICDHLDFYSPIDSGDSEHDGLFNELVAAGAYDIRRTFELDNVRLANVVAGIENIVYSGWNLYLIDDLPLAGQYSKYVRHVMGHLRRRYSYVLSSHGMNSLRVLKLCCLAYSGGVRAKKLKGLSRLSAKLLQSQDIILGDYSNIHEYEMPCVAEEDATIIHLNVDLMNGSYTVQHEAPPAEIESYHYN